jgi:hypothetical protein
MPDFGIFRGFNDKLFGDKLYAGQLPINLGMIASDFFVGLLDLYPNAAAAYSLRKLRISYTGSAIEVRRTNNDVADIGFTSTGELDTAALLAFTGTGALDNGFITTWYDQSGNGYDAIQTTAINQPQIVSNGSVITENGKAALRFDGINDTLRMTGTMPLIERSFSFVGKQNTAQADAGIISFRPIGGSNDFRSPDTFVFSTTNNSVTPKRAYTIEGSTSGSYSLQKNGTGTDVLQYGLYMETKTSGEGKLYENGVLQVTDSSFTEFNSENTQAFNLGARNFTNTSITNFFNGQFQEFVYWEVNNISNRTGIETNINDFYSIY